MKSILHRITKEIDKNSLKKTGVYKIENKENKKVYIGSSSKRFSNRLSNHLRDLIENRHHSKHLQHTFNIDKNFDKFEISILEICDPEDCIKNEQKWIDFYKSYIDKFGYNTSPTAGSCLGIKKSEEEKIKIFERSRKITDDKIVEIFYMRNELNFTYTKISTRLNITKNQVASILTKPNKYKYVKQEYNLKLKNKFQKEFSKDDVVRVHKLYEIDKYSVSDISKILNIGTIKLRHLIYNKNIYRDEKEGLIFNIELNRKSKLEKKKNKKERIKKVNNNKQKTIIPVETIEEIFKLKYSTNLTEQNISDELNIFPKEVDLILTFRYQKRKYNKLYLDIKTRYDLRQKKTLLIEQDIINIFYDYNSGGYLIEELSEKYNFHDVGVLLKNSRIPEYYKKIIEKNELKVHKKSTKNINLKKNTQIERNKNRSKNYKLIDPDGKEIIVKNLADFCKDKELDDANLSRVSKNGKTYKGWKCFCLS